MFFTRGSIQIFLTIRVFVLETSRTFLLLWSRYVASLEVLLLDIGADLFQNEFNRLVKVGNVSHLELRSVSQKGNHVTVPKESLDGSHLDNVRVHNFGHVLSSDSGGDTDAAGGDLVSDPDLSAPRGNGGDDSNDRQNRNRGDDGFRDGGGSLVVDFLWRERDRGLVLTNVLCNGSSFAFSALCLGGTSSQHFNGAEVDVSLCSLGFGFVQRLENGLRGFFREQRSKGSRRCLHTRQGSGGGSKGFRRIGGDGQDG
mmetsp:Transcript_10569/g.22567  ORF Transcript_10569/g.22567 Transcript_10569/m.22567 type:complete len:256 (-) Transcript_10569:175-942(-)